MNYYFTLTIILYGYMTFWFLISRIKKRNDVADVAWGLGFILLAWTSLILSHVYSVRGILATALVSVWGIRLAWHIYRRNKGKTEDYRYAAWKKEWGKWFIIRSYLQVYLLQGLFLFLIIQPVVFINKSNVDVFVLQY